MTKLQSPFKYDVVGSFLRPEVLKKAREDFKNGKIDASGLKAVEDSCIEELISKQKANSLKAITDGEFRRSWWHLDFMWGLNGIEKVETNKGYNFSKGETRAESAQVVGKISGENHPFVAHYEFVKQFEDENTVARQTIPSPAQTFQEIIKNNGEQKWQSVYADENSLIEDLVKAYKRVISDLYRAGCRSLQIDDCTWGALVDEAYVAKLEEVSGLNSKEIQQRYVDLNNAVCDGLPDDLVVTTHVCRGNYRSTYFGKGGYDDVAEILLGKENVDAYYLEFDDERSGSFEPLKHLSGDKKVVLGLVTTKRPELEDPNELKRRIQEAAEIVGLERLCLSPQCGFSSTEEGNALTEEEQWAKIKLVKEVAEEVWGK